LLPDPEIEPQSFELDRVWLRFRDPAVEAVFLSETVRSSINAIRGYFLAGTALYALFALLDLVVRDKAMHLMLIIRLGIVVPILFVLFCTTFFSIFYKVVQAALATAMLVSGLGIVAMTAIMAPPFNSQYSIIISAFLVTSYQVAVLMNPIPATTFVANNFFLLLSAAVGLFSGYTTELYIRKAYVGQRVVEAKNRLVSEALREAVRANKSKSEFLATMSHELRTPLNAIIGFSEIIMRELFGALANDRYVDYAKDIHHSGAHLLAIINDILDLAKAESGKLQLSEDEFPISDLLTQCQRICGHIAKSNRVKLDFFCAEQDLCVYADKRLLVQILVNLISNAIKFAPEGAVRVQVSAHYRDGIVISVSDDGIGIAPENIERVMKAFEQVEASYTRVRSGCGLGLPYAKSLTELHGGTLKIESQLECGTTVIVNLPAGRIVGNASASALKSAG